MKPNAGILAQNTFKLNQPKTAEALANHYAQREGIPYGVARYYCETASSYKLRVVPIITESEALAADSSAINYLHNRTRQLVKSGAWKLMKVICPKPFNA